MSLLNVPPVTTVHRDANDTNSPAYLLGPFGMRYRYSMSVLWDALADGMAFAVFARFPSTAPPDAFGYLSADRLMLQGFAESQASYEGRLVQWLDLWGFAGLPTGILLEELGYVLPVQPQIRTVDNHGQWNTYAASTTPLAAPPASMPTPPNLTTAAFNFRWDSVSWPTAYAELWSRLWLVLYSLSGSPWAAPSAVYGTGHAYGDGTCWGWAGTNAQAAALTALARRWRAGHVKIPFVIVSYDSTMFDPTLSFGSAKLPDGTWGFWSKVSSNQYVPSRPAATTCSFLDGS